jgi:uroporphyrinogen-III synthase
MITFLFRSEEPAYATVSSGSGGPCLHTLPLCKALARTGAAARFRPVLNTALDASGVPPDLADRYSAVVFTSGKAVEAVAAVKGLAWPSIACFVVGKATAAKARTLLAVTEVGQRNRGEGVECIPFH